MTDKELATIPDQKPEVQIFNPLDAEPVAFAKHLASRKDNFLALTMHLRGILIDGKDFGRIHVANKEKCPRPWECSFETNRGHWTGYTMFSSGADKVLATLGLTASYPDDQDYRRACLQGMALQDIMTKCSIVDGYGQVICEGMGACSRSEDKNGNLNNVLKKALKRARMDAVLRIPSASAIFENDFLEELAKSKAGKTVNQQAREVNPKHSTGARIETMPFGKHKGVRFAQIPVEYLDFILEKMNDKPDIQEAAKREYERRDIAPVSNSGASNQGENINTGGDPRPEPPPIHEDDFDDDIPF